MKFTRLAYTVTLLIVGLGLAVNAYSQSFLTNGLVAYYPFNGNANDASGNGNNATAEGNYQYLTNGALHLIGDGLLFYSGGGYVALPNYGNLNSSFTISMWVRNENDQGNGIMSEYYVWFQNSGSTLWFGQYDLDTGSAGFPYTVANFAQFASSWNQLLIVSSPSYSAAYLSGTNIASTNISGSFPFPTVYSAIGRHWWNGGADSSARMTMDVKNFRIYNRALSSNEVAELYAIESTPPSPPCSPHTATATATLDDGFVVAATITDGGCGYTNTPSVLIVGGGGTGATATAVVSNGVVVGVTITDAGIGYTSTPTVVDPIL